MFPLIYPLGDSAATLTLGNCIDPVLSSRVLAMAGWIRKRQEPGVLDTIVAYSSVSVRYDLTVVTDRTAITDLLMEAWRQSAGADHRGDGRSIRIPVCYEAEYGPDLEAVARSRGLSPAELINTHCSIEYRIYMIGFLPGFPYMGKLDPRLEVPRKLRPVPVLAGGVGIAGLQTGIYPLDSPGGWQIIGRTPVKLFDRDVEPPIWLLTGDRVQFYPVSAAEFMSWRI